MSIVKFNFDWNVEMEEIWRDAFKSKTVCGVWAEYLRKYVKPSGWEVFWKIPPARNYELNLKCDTTIGGTVMKINFDELEASVLTKPLRPFGVGRLCTVPLIELWATKDEESIAKCIEKLRYFYQNLWMPWDDAYEGKPQHWFDKYLLRRTAFSDLSKSTYSPGIANYLGGLLIEHGNIQEKLNSNEPMSANLLSTLKQRLVEIAEKFEHLNDPNNIEPFIAIMSEGGPNQFIVCEEQETFAQYVKTITVDFTNKNRINYRSSLQECIEESTALKHCRIDILCEVENYEIEIFQPFSNGAIKGISNWPGASNASKAIANSSAARKKDNYIYDDNKPVVVCSTQIQFTGDYVIENIKVNCRNGLWIRNGVVVLRNCEIIGSGSSLKGIGIRVTNGCKIILENSVIKNFAMGIYMEETAETAISQSSISKCKHDVVCTHTYNLTIDKLSKIRKPTIFTILPNFLDADDIRIIDETCKLIHERLLKITKNC